MVKAGNAAARGGDGDPALGQPPPGAGARGPGIEHIELETTPDFFDLFVDGCQFKPMPAHLVPEGTAA